jgi:hypothetical protein
MPGIVTNGGPAVLAFGVMSVNYQPFDHVLC